MGIRPLLEGTPPPLCRAGQGKPRWISVSVKGHAAGGQNYHLLQTPFFLTRVPPGGQHRVGNQRRTAQLCTWWLDTDFSTNLVDIAAMEFPCIKIGRPPRPRRKPGGAPVLSRGTAGPAETPRSRRRCSSPAASARVGKATGVVGCKTKTAAW